MSAIHPRRAGFAGVAPRGMMHGLLDEAEARFQRALDWCERERCPVEAGRCLQGLAEVAEQRGEQQKAMAYLDRAAALSRSTARSCTSTGRSRRSRS